jgi:UDP-3-O-[3-hydroxymyristoyl] glucosamine N-acyltransferase
VGSAPEIERATAVWHALAPELELRPVEVDPEAGEATVAVVLDALDFSDATAFVAADARFLNLFRLDLMGSLRLRGIPMPALVERGAIVADDVRIADNCWIGAGAIIQPGCRIGFNAVLGAGAIVGSGASIGHSCWIDQGVVIGRSARVGAQVTLGLGVIVGHGVEIGKLCIVDQTGRIEKDLAAKTFIHASHRHPIVIVGE